MDWSSRGERAQRVEAVADAIGEGWLTVGSEDTEMIGAVNVAAARALLAEFVRRGVGHVVASPGSRSTPLILAAADAAEAGEVELHVQIDERVAGFMALGIGLQTGTPAVLVCTSGTAAVNFAPSVVESGLSGVPMIVATADRPPELRHRGAPQTIDQLELYGSSVRWFVDLPLPDESDTSMFVRAASEAIDRSHDGPVHLNVPFREPLLSAELRPKDRQPTERLPEDVLGASGARRAWPTSSVHERRVPDLGPVPSEVVAARAGVIIAGGRSGIAPEDVERLAERLQWPIIADPLSGVRHHANAVTAADAILRASSGGIGPDRDGLAASLQPDVVVRVGRPPASKAVAEWVETAGCPLVQVGGPGYIDPGRNVTAFCDLDALDAVTHLAPPGWLARWKQVNAIAEQAITSQLAGDMLSDPLIARTIAEQLGADEQLMVSSSMPVRDLEWFGGPTARAVANRGANGIDGVAATGLGVALTGIATKVLIGDLAMIHDTNTLVGLRHRDVDLTIIVVDNDGGGIFSFLPQASMLAPERFERLFGTPTGTDIVALALSHGIEAIDIDSASDLRSHLAQRGRRSRLLRVRTDRSENVGLHRRINLAVADALAEATLES